MDLINSTNLVLKKFFIANTTLLSVFPESGRRIRFDRLKLVCDFDIFMSEKEEDKIDFIVNFNIKCNEEEKPGYYFDISAVGEFTLKSIEAMNDNVENQYILFTALPMIINSTRVYIQNITSMHPFGSYLLPTLDLGKLIENKSMEDDFIEIEE